MTSKPTRERILELLDVCTETGVILWRKSQGRAKAGAVAGRIHKYGHREISVDGQQLMAHAIVWLVATGEWAPLVDHRDGRRDNNAYTNLRLADSATNARNRTNWVHRKLLGAFALENGRFAARITADGISYHLGVFGSEQAAHEQYKTARSACDLAERRARILALEQMTTNRNAA